MAPQAGHETQFCRVLAEEIPFYYIWVDRRHTLMVGQKPVSLQKNKITNQRELRHYKHTESYTNPIHQAREYSRMMQELSLTQTALASKLGISRVRVTQMLNLLKLSPEQQDYILKHGKNEQITERKLRQFNERTKA